MQIDEAAVQLISLLRLLWLSAGILEYLVVGRPQVGIMRGLSRQQQPWHRWHAPQGPPWLKSSSQKSLFLFFRCATAPIDECMRDETRLKRL